MRSILWAVRRLARRFSFDFSRFNKQNADFQILELIKRRHVTHIIDTGANRGQFAHYMRLQGFSGAIDCFEPLPKAFEELTKVAIADAAIRAHNVALSDRSGRFKFYVGTNDQTSSLQPVGEGANSYIVQSHEIEVTTHRLDELIESKAIAEEVLSQTILKLDVQGHELSALEGCGVYLNRFAGIFLEAAIERIYEGETTFIELVEFLSKRGFKIIAFKGGYFHPEIGNLMQIDILFENFEQI